MRISDWSSDVCSSDLLCVRITVLATSVALALAASGTASALTATDWVQCVPAEVIPPFADAAPPLPAGDESTVVSASPAQYLDRSRTVFDGDVTLSRPEERRVGKGRGSKCKSGWSSYNL